MSRIETALDERSKLTQEYIADNQEALAIVGIGCRFPGGVVDPESFWEFLAEGRSGIVDVPADRWDLQRFHHENPSVPGRMNSRRGGFVDNMDLFDAKFWGITPREAMRMDPQQRWLLEVAWEAIEDSGVAPSRLQGEKVGCFVGIATHDYSGIQGQTFDETDAHTNSGSTLSIASNRISYLLDLKGPALSVDTACSSSLVALSIACRSIWAGECDAALVGGVNAMCAPHATVGFAKASMLSPDGQCFAFDSRANGYVRGEGAGMVYVKRLDKALADKDPIYAVLRTAVMNQDGHTSSMTVPGADAQAAMLRRAYKEVGIDPTRVMYMEAHGTGTPVGDPIEASALGRVLSEGRMHDDRCLIGSVKSNIGHLEAGSGIAGLIKAALVLHKDQVPPNRNFESPNPNIPFDELKLKVSTKLQPLPHQDGLPPVTAVNSFGFGGTNSHAVLEASPQTSTAQRSQDPKLVAERPCVLTISARDGESLRSYAREYTQFLAESPESLADICAAAGARKEHHDERLVVLGDSKAQVIERLNEWLADDSADSTEESKKELAGILEGRATNQGKPITFVFTGQGAQWWKMGQELIQREPLFRGTLEQIDQELQKFGDFSLVEEMTKSEEQSRINDTNIAQPAIFALQVALAELWKSWGVTPAQVVGHSVGEVAAAYVAGVYSLADAVKIIYHRSRLQNTTAGLGKMVAAGISSKEASALIGDNGHRVQIAAVNSPYLVTIAGETAVLDQIVARLEADGKFFRWLPVDYPFHTHLMAPIKDELLHVLADIQPKPARIPFISTVTGGVFSAEKMTADYWWANVRNPVLFAPAIDNLVAHGADLFLELGPHPALKSSVNECLAERGVPGQVFHSLRRKTDETEEMLGNAVALHVHGSQIDWAAVNQGEGRHLRLPKYPWNRESYWLESDLAAHFRLSRAEHPLLGLRFPAANPTWEFQLDPRLFPYLDSHVFWDSILFPAAGYGEIAIAMARAAFPDDNYTVENLEVKKALFISENNVPTVRVELDPVEKTFSIRSSTGNLRDWDTHVVGRLTLLTSDPPEQEDMDALRAQFDTQSSHEEYYDELYKCGFHFGPHFKLINNVWRGKVGEGLIEVPIPGDELIDLDGHHFHPILLDACLQVAKAAVDAPANSAATRELFLPRRLERIRLYENQVTDRFWAWGRQRFYGEDHLIFDILVFDDEGNRVCDILGFRSELMEHIRDTEDVENCLYEYRWEIDSEDETADEESEHKSELVASTNGKPVPEPAAEPAGEEPPMTASYVVFADQSGFADSLLDQLVQRDDEVTRIEIGEAFGETDRGYTVRLDSEEDLRGALEKIGPADAILHCWSLDHEADEQLSLPAIEFAQQSGVLSGLKLAHVLGGQDPPSVPQIYFVTRDAQRVVEADKITRALSSPIVGMSRVAFNEHPEVSWTLIDLPAESTSDDVSMLIEELKRDDSDREIAFRNGERYLRRVHRTRAVDLPKKLRNAVLPDGDVIPYKLQIETPGILSNLSLNETERGELDPNFVEARVVAAGINFRNVMKALGMPIGNTLAFPGYGEDFAGVITRVGDEVTEVSVGDEVFGMGTYSFRSHTMTPWQGVVKKPRHMSFADAATLPTVFLTSYYALVRLARMQPGEKVLIHAGTGGVGQAAIQIALDLGLEIFSTAGSDEKRELLKELGAHHIMNSRTLDFVDDVMRITDGYGVDCVLNSLAGDYIQKSLAILAPFGRFIEIGKVDIHNNTKIGMRLLQDNIIYTIFDLIEYILQRPEDVASVFAELGEKVADGTYKPLAHNDFPITDVEEAYRFMAQGKHVGKNVLTFEHDPIMIGPCTDDGKLFRKDGSYLVTGGASGFGLEIAKWMALNGAGHLVLMSRSGPRDEQSQEMIQQILDWGSKVTDARGDVTSLEDVQRVVDQIAKDDERPLAGVIHGAMVLQDEFIADLDDELFQKVLRPKMNGAWNLHVATRDLPLDHFICFSSFSAVIGAPKQANYNAGNVYLDALAQYRHARGLPALTINWGALSGAGFVARNEKTAAYLDAIGMKSISVEEALRVMRRVLQHDTPQVLASRADWQLWKRKIALVSQSSQFVALTNESCDDAAGGSIGPRIMAADPEQRPAILETFIAENLAAVCSIEVDGIDLDAPLTSLGLDSLMAVELMNRIEGELGLSVPMGKVLSGPSIRELGEIVLQMMAGGEEGSADGGSEGAGAGGTLAPLERTERKPEFPLSVAQLEIWDRYLAAPNSSQFNVAFTAEVTPKLDPNNLRLAIEKLSERHASLTSTFLLDGQTDVLQKVRSAYVDFQDHDVTDLDAEAKFQLINARANHPFSLEHGPVARVELITSEKEESDQLLVVCHGIVADRPSLKTIVDDLLSIYGELSTGTHVSEPLPSFGFEDYVVWQRDFLNSEAANKKYAYWQQQLHRAPASLDLPIEAGGVSGSEPEYGSYRFELPAALSQQFMRLAAEQHVSLHDAMLTAFNTLWHHVAAQCDLVVGCAMDGRQHQELAQVVGPMENLVAIRSRVASDTTFTELLESTVANIADARAQQQMPIAKLADIFVLPQDDRPPVAQVVFRMPAESSIETTCIPSFLLGKSGHKFWDHGLAVASLDTDLANGERELTLTMVEAGGTVYGAWQFDKAKFSRATIERFASSFEHLLAQVAANPGADVASFDVGEGRGDGFGDWRTEYDVTELIIAPADAELTPVDYDQEIKLADEIVAPVDTSCDVDKFDRVFLTGATGFVGAHLIEYVQQNTDATIVCLVRAPDEQAAMDRVRANMAQYRADFDESRIETVIGELTQPLLGLSREKFAELAENIDVIYHNGASIDLAMPYRKLRNVNVNGTHEVLRLALTSRLKPTHIVSSYAVHASREYEMGERIDEQRPLPDVNSLANGYSKTKWVVEHLAMQAREMGLPVSIYRPGNITGHSESGVSNTGDIMHTLVMSCMHVGSLPELDIDIDLTPVDYVAAAIVELSRSKECVGGTYHLLNPQPLRIDEMAHWVEQVVGEKVERVSIAEWRRQLAALADSVPAEVMGVMSEVLTPNAASGREEDAIPSAFLSGYDNQMAEQGLRGTGVSCHPVDGELLSCYMKHLQEVGFLDVLQLGVGS